MSGPAQEQLQYAGGLFGPIVIHGPRRNTISTSVPSCSLYHNEYSDTIEEMIAPGGSPKVESNNNLINDGKRHRLRLINSGASGLQRFSIDKHTITVIAVDLVSVKPYNTSVVTLRPYAVAVVCYDQVDTLAMSSSRP
ncbi:hypothetical protein VTH82DRAFT_7886 [Thermothelomyces myriococcoides]